MSTVKVSSFKNDLKIGSNCIICEDTKIQGDVTIGNGTILHPRVSIIAESGPIIIGEHNLIEEKAIIINKSDIESSCNSSMVIGDYNVFEVGCRCESIKVGDYNIFETKSKTGRETAISNNCIIGSGCTVTNAEVLPENTAFYGTKSVTRVSQSHQTQILQMDFLNKVLPNYHRIVKKKKPSASNLVQTP